LINIGSRCTNIVFIDKGKFFARVIPLGGYSITQQISKEMGISFAEAEELKKKEGYIPLDGHQEEGDEKTKAISNQVP
jgi:cell division ATPase FtsA